MEIYRLGMAGGFAHRHRALVLALWAQVPIVAVVGLATDQTTASVGIACLVLVAFAVSAMLVPGRLLAASLVAFGLAAAASLVVRYGGDIEILHLYFPVILVAAAIYQDARPVLIALLAISGYHLVMVSLMPETGDALWVAAHVGFLTLLTVTLIAGWRLRETPPLEHDDRYRIGFSTAPIGMAVVKLSGEFVEVNTTLATTLGHTTEHFPGRNIRAFLHGDDMPLLGEAWEEMGNSASHTSSQWMRCLTASGDAIWARVSLALVPHTQRQPALVVLAVEETTAFRNEQSKLEGLIRGRAEFVAAVGEEIREPLGILIDLTSGDEPGLRAINASALEIASTIDDLVTSARADSSPPDVVATSFDAAAICRDITTRLGEGADVSVDVRTSTVWADPEMTRQILTSLITTAIRYGGERVRLQMFNSGPDTVIQIIDDGPAVPDDQRERMFQADLRRGEPATRPAAVGLSLTVARDLARRMDGDVVYRRSGDGLNVLELRLPSEDLTRTYKPRPRPRLAASESV
ncbi:MAG TPA: PAS domain S-box protein [Acidimicrobiia bacterium]|nr:PAS domain S-box protein [Acidimicrobiia bacterium]